MPKQKNVSKSTKTYTEDLEKEAAANSITIQKHTEYVRHLEKRQREIEVALAEKSNVIISHNVELLKEIISFHFSKLSADATINDSDTIIENTCAWMNTFSVKLMLFDSRLNAQKQLL